MGYGISIGSGPNARTVRNRLLDISSPDSSVQAEILRNYVCRLLDPPTAIGVKCPPSSPGRPQVPAVVPHAVLTPGVTGVTGEPRHSEKPGRPKTSINTM